MNPGLLLALVALAQGGAAQDGAAGGAGPRPPAPEAGGWELVDRIEIIVDEDVLTYSRLEARVREVLSRVAVTTREEMARLRSQIAEDEVRQLLMVQRGRELGFDPANVERTVKDFLERRIEEEGGLSSFSDRLAANDESGVERKRRVTEELYGLSYDRAITGQSVGPGGREIVDRYVRPGLLRLHYEESISDPDGLRALGGEPERVVFRQLAIDAERAGGPDAARARIEDLREQVLAGGLTFEDAVTLFGAIQERGGLTDPLPVANLERLEPELGRFAREAEVGDLSPVMPIRNGERVLGFRVVQLVERLPAEVPPFEDREVQARLREAVLARLDEERRRRALRKAFEAAYVWTASGARPEEAGPRPAGGAGEGAAPGGGAAPPPPDEEPGR